MSDFRELRLPQLASDGRWYVGVAKSAMEFLGKDGTIVKPIICSGNDHMYFDNEWDAHRTACNYYHVETRAYPYINEYAACDIPDIVPDIPEPSNGSEVMEFI